MIDLPEDEIQLLNQKIQHISDSDLHMLFDMMMKSLQDLHRAADPQIVFEIALLRMSQAPQIADLKAFLAGEQTPVIALPKRSEPPPTTTVSIPTAQVLTKPYDFDANRWLAFVQTIKSSDAFFASKIENLLFLGCKDLKIGLQPPMNLTFLADQLQNSEMRQKLQGLIDSEFGQGYNFEVLKGRADAQGESANTLATKKKVQADEQREEEWKLDPRVQKAKQVFKGEVKMTKKES